MCKRKWRRSANLILIKYRTHARSFECRSVHSLCTCFNTAHLNTVLCMHCSRAQKKLTTILFTQPEYRYYFYCSRDVTLLPSHALCKLYGRRGGGGLIIHTAIHTGYKNFRKCFSTLHIFIKQLFYLSCQFHEVKNRCEKPYKIPSVFSPFLFGTE